MTERENRGEWRRRVEEERKGERGLSLGEEGGAVVDHEFEERVSWAGREVGEEGLAAGGGQCSRCHQVALTVLHYLQVEVDI